MGEVEEIAEIRAANAARRERDRVARRRSAAALKGAITKAARRRAAADAAPRPWRLYGLAEVPSRWGGMSTQFDWAGAGLSWSPEDSEGGVIAELERWAAVAEELPDPDDPYNLLAEPLPPGDLVLVRGTRIYAIVPAGEPGRRSVLRVRDEAEGEI